MSAKPKTTDEYLSTVSPDRRVLLEKLRRTVHAVVPGVEECISYSMPAFRYHGHVIAGFLATRKGCSYFPFSGTTLTTLAPHLAAYDRTKSALHFDAKRVLPVSLVRKLLAARIVETQTTKSDLIQASEKSRVEATRKVPARSAKDVPANANKLGATKAQGKATKATKALGKAAKATKASASRRTPARSSRS